MRKLCRLAILWLLLPAFLIGSATGARLVLVQSIAWGTMFTNYSKHYSLSEAARRTFDGKHPCGICKRIQQTREVAGVSVLLAGSESVTLQQQRFYFFAGTVDRKFNKLPTAWKSIPVMPLLPPPRA
jgi:hypothetical protein